MTHHHIRLSVALVVLLLASLACRFFAADPGLVGTWQGSYEGDSIEITFGDDDRFEIYVGESVTLGHYRVDMSTTPIQLDLVPDGGGAILTIIEFVDDDTLRMENTYNGQPRPTTFNDTATFYRVNP